MTPVHMLLKTQLRSANGTGNGNGRRPSDVEKPSVREPLLSDDKVDVLGCTLDRVDLSQALARCEAVIESRGFAQHMAINVAKLVAMRDDDDLRSSVAQSELVTADGQPIVWASKLLRDPLPARVAGIDLMNGLLALSAEKGYKVYILGARKNVLERAVECLRKRFPGIAIAGYRDGYYEDAEEAAVAESIAAARPDILLVAMSSPRKEYFLARYRDTMGVPFVMGVGGAIDILAGITRRAPVLLQRLGLEWLFRLLQEPRRLARRYLMTNTRFVMLLSGALLRDRLTRKAASHPLDPDLEPHPADEELDELVEMIVPALRGRGVLGEQGRSEAVHA